MANIWAFWVVIVGIGISANAAVVPLSRESRLEVSATAGASTYSDSRFYTSFDHLNHTMIDASAAVPGGESSWAKAYHYWSLGEPSGGLEAYGGALTDTYGSAISSASSTLKFQFVTDRSGWYRFGWSISRSRGDVVAYLRDLSAPSGSYMSYREATTTNLSNGEIWFEQVELLSGRAYEIFLDSSSQNWNAGTSYSVELSVVPEPTALALLMPLLIVMRRRRT